jgi:cell shape-determining protein MreC
MKRKRLLSLILFAVLLAIMSLPQTGSDMLRNVSTAIFAPFWRTLTTVKQRVLTSFGQGEETVSIIEFQKLSLENQQLKTELAASDLLAQESTSLARSLQRPQKLPATPSESSKHAAENRRKLLQNRLEAVPATVIYRPPSVWSSSLWIDQGSYANEQLGRKVIDKNSPVVVGNALVGMIDYVGKRQSRVRLITDSGLTMSVRAARGAPQNQLLSDSIDILMAKLISEKESSFASTQDQRKFVLQLRRLQKSYLNSQETLLLAKGELHGSSTPFWRSRGQLLKGVGFNYDFADAEGPARDLRSGIPYGQKSNVQPMKLLQIGDLLVTTGLDGVFPAGLPVAEVVEVGELEEGDYAYELRARPVAGDLSELSLLFVLPPLGYDPTDQP